MGVGSDLLPELHPAIVGDGNIAEATWSSITPKNSAGGLEMGDLNVGAVRGLAAGLSFLSQYDQVELIEHERGLLERIEIRLQDIARCKLLGPAGFLRGGILSFTVEGMDVHDVAMYLNELVHVVVRSGQMCAQPLITDLGATNVVQVSVAPFISEDDVEFFARHLQEIISEFA
jgi:cysteine sulfinate desulfinase